MLCHLQARRLEAGGGKVYIHRPTTIGQIVYRRELIINPPGIETSRRVCGLVLQHFKPGGLKQCLALLIHHSYSAL
jgi:hypothetical protein